MDADPARLRAVFPREVEPTIGLTTLAEVLGRRPGFDRVVEALTAGLAEALGVPLVPAGLSADESAMVDALVAEKYGTEAWTVSAGCLLDRGPTARPTRPLRSAGSRTAARPGGRAEERGELE